MKKASIAAAMAFMMQTASAGELSMGGVITKVANTSNNISTFAIHVEGDSGPCASAGYILFPDSAVSDPSIQRRAFAIAMLAYTTGATVKIYNYASDSCDGATFIEIL